MAPSIKTFTISVIFLSLLSVFLLFIVAIRPDFFSGGEGHILQSGVDQRLDFLSSGGVGYILPSHIDQRPDFSSSGGEGHIFQSEIDQRLSLPSSGLEDHISTKDFDNRIDAPPSGRETHILENDIDQSSLKAASLAIAYSSEFMVGIVGICLIWSLYNHLGHFKIPNEQIPQLVILFLPSVWAVTSLAGVVFSESEMLDIIMNAIEETYADLAVGMFFSLLMGNLTNNAPNGDIDGLLQEMEINIFGQAPIAVNPSWSKFLKLCTWQSCIVRFFGTFVLLLLYANPWIPSWVGTICSVVFFRSATFSLCAVMSLFRACVSRLSLDSPIEKLACIKAAVFVQYWQEKVVFYWLKRFGVMFSLESELPHALLILEMCTLAMVQCYYFSAAPYHGYVPIAAADFDDEVHPD